MRYNAGVMPGPRVSSVEFVDPVSSVAPESGDLRVTVRIEGGKDSTFRAATFDGPGRWMAADRAGHWFSEPVLYLRRIDETSIGAAVDSMASQLGGYWLRYYRAAPGSPSACGVATASVDRVNDGCGVVEVVLKDGREFSILAATPTWWRSEMQRRKASFYFGPLVLFLQNIDSAHAKRAAKHMAARDELLFCRYDTPRKILPEILDAFFSVGGASF